MNRTSVTPRRATEFMRMKFWKYVMPEPNSGCWIWMGTRTTKDYGKMYLKGGGSYIYAHRLSALIHKGPIPRGKVIDHLCRVTCCVNPDHLEITTNRINAFRGKRHSCAFKGDDACFHGHNRTSANTYTDTNGTLTCRVCARAANSRHRARKREASRGG